jgi:hypothetical protein
MPRTEIILHKIAYPRHVGYVPVKIFTTNLGVTVLAALQIMDELEGWAVYLPFISFFLIHFAVMRQYQRDPFIERVWIQWLMPPDFRTSGARRTFRLRTTNLVREPGRKYVPV